MEDVWAEICVNAWITYTKLNYISWNNLACKDDVQGYRWTLKSPLSSSSSSSSSSLQQHHICGLVAERLAERHGGPYGQQQLPTTTVFLKSLRYCWLAKEKPTKVKWEIAVKKQDTKSVLFMYLPKGHSMALGFYNWNRNETKQQRKLNQQYAQIGLWNPTIITREGWIIIT